VFSESANRPDLPQKSTICALFKAKSVDLKTYSAPSYEDKIVKKKTLKVNTCSQCEVSRNVCYHVTIILLLGWVSGARFFYQWEVTQDQSTWKYVGHSSKNCSFEILYCHFVVVESVHIPLVWKVIGLNYPSPMETLNSSASYFVVEMLAFDTLFQDLEISIIFAMDYCVQKMISSSNYSASILLL